MNADFKKYTAKLFEPDPEIEFRIQNDTERFRKGFGKIVLKDSQGNPVKHARVSLKLTKHEFQFGCNAFMYDEFPDDEKNQAYAETFKEYFNLAVVPFYWSTLEPEDGKLRFAKNSPKIFRRPAPDLVLEFCEKNNITPKGHPLLWYAFFPEWAPRKPELLKERIERHIAEIADRYKGRIRNFDVLNEVLVWDDMVEHSMPESHVEFVFRLAEKYFPAGTTLNYNEAPHPAWGYFGMNNREYTPLLAFAREMLSKGCRIDCLGLQAHYAVSMSPREMFDYKLGMNSYGRMYDPAHLFRMMDGYASLGIPFNISEITIPGNEAYGGEEGQAEVTEKLYRIWFSHPGNTGIIWWNMVDGTAAYAPLGSLEGENQWQGGFVNYDFSRKKSAEVLHRLIHKEWTTNVSFDYADGAPNKFHGFYGDYELTVKMDSGEEKLNFGLYKNIKNTETFTLKG